MKTQAFLIITIALVLGVLNQLMPDATLSGIQEAVAAPVDGAMKQHVLKTAVRILMFFPVVDDDQGDTDQQSMTFTAAVGLGTLVSHNGEILIVTHDHWGHPMSELALVEFRNAYDELLLELNGVSFSQLVRHQDSGTMIIEAPKALLANQDTPLLPVQLEASVTELASSGNLSVAAGDVVLVVRQRPENPNVADVLAASVAATGERNGLVTLELRSADGQSIVPGDSGGGVFLNGRLVGNLWSTEMATGKRYFGFLTINNDTTGTDRSTVASLPLAAVNGK